MLRFIYNRGLPMGTCQKKEVPWRFFPFCLFGLNAKSARVTCYFSCIRDDCHSNSILCTKSIGTLKKTEINTFSPYWISSVFYIDLEMIFSDLQPLYLYWRPIRVEIFWPAMKESCPSKYCKYPGHWLSMSADVTSRVTTLRSGR